jgi:tripartite-type tricarboxylate transporter receptor subunit TctC
MTSPDVPTLRELGYDIASCSMFVVSGPPNLPAEIKEPLAAALKTAIQSAEMTALVQRMRYPEYYQGPDDVTRLLEYEAGTFARALAHIRE